MSETDWIINAGMYAVTPEVQAGWRALVEHVARNARVPLKYVPDLLAQPIDELCTRGDIGAVQMCGYTIALKRAPVIPMLHRSRVPPGQPVARSIAPT